MAVAPHIRNNPYIRPLPSGVPVQLPPTPIAHQTPNERLAQDQPIVSSGSRTEERRKVVPRKTDVKKSAEALVGSDPSSKRGSIKQNLCNFVGVPPNSCPVCGQLGHTKEFCSLSSVQRPKYRPKRLPGQAPDKKTKYVPKGTE